MEQRAGLTSLIKWRQTSCGGTMHQCAIKNLIPINKHVKVLPFGYDWELTFTTGWYLVAHPC